MKEKKPFCRIDWSEDCNLDYNHTICEFNDLSAQIDAVENSFTEVLEDINYNPSFKVSLVFLTEDEFNKEIDNYEQ